jgi:hypothetical protein
MTEQNLIDGGTQNSSPAPVVTSSPAPVSNDHAQEKMLRQSEVDGIVKGAKLDAHKRGYEEGLSASQKQQLANSQSPTTPQPVSGNQPLSADEFKRLAREEAQSLFQQQQNHYASQQMVHQFINKMEAGKQKYPDFETRVARLQIDKMPELIPLLNQTENAADVIYDLADENNPHKITNILSTLRDPRTSHFALMQMQALSKSIKANEDAKKQPSVEEPLSQLSHSTMTMDNGSVTVRDRRRDPKLRV